MSDTDLETASATNGAVGNIDPPKPAGAAGVVLDDLGGDDDDDEDEEAALKMGGDQADGKRDRVSTLILAELMGGR